MAASGVAAGVPSGTGVAAPGFFGRDFIRFEYLSVEQGVRSRDTLW
ncbi:MAG: hypothetical protein R2845_05885 [Thermomicrobiales bacterium]